MEGQNEELPAEYRYSVSENEIKSMRSCELDLWLKIFSWLHVQIDVYI